MLGTAGPELTGGDRASSSYLLWVDGKARVLVDTGPGSVQRFRRSGAAFEDIDTILYSHFHTDHSGDFASYAKGAFFTERQKNLHVFGPSANTAAQALTLSTTDFVQKSIGEEGLYPYLSALLQPTAQWHIIPHTVEWDTEHRTAHEITAVADDIKISSIAANHGPLPALAWRIEAAGCSISFSGDMSGISGNLPELIKGSDILVAHHAIPESETGVGAFLHMKPSYIAETAQNAGVKQLLLTHIMERTADTRTSKEIVRKTYTGKLSFPMDLERYTP